MEELTHEDKALFIRIQLGSMSSGGRDVLDPLRLIYVYY
jgi:hypothetical protein